MWMQAWRARQECSASLATLIAEVPDIQAEEAATRYSDLIASATVLGLSPSSDANLKEAQRRVEVSLHHAAWGCDSHDGLAAV